MPARAIEQVIQAPSQRSQKVAPALTSWNRVSPNGNNKPLGGQPSQHNEAKTALKHTDLYQSQKVSVYRDLGASGGRAES